ncbi:hypothetical protein [Pseudomonas helleri]|uniref:hypothetical protein n=1 Tax=Pseudomonas helleri TaxID=1608996 RepID=UPI003FD24997
MTDKQKAAAVWTNASQNPVILSDGSAVAPGEGTTPEQAEFAKGSFWEEHGVLILGAPKVGGDEVSVIAELKKDIEALTSQKVDALAQIDTLTSSASELNQKLSAALADADTLRQENVTLKASAGTIDAQLSEAQAKVKTQQAEIEALKKAAK